MIDVVEEFLDFDQVDHELVNCMLGFRNQAQNAGVVDEWVFDGVGFVVKRSIHSYLV